ncbi:MAG: branched-chain amino acid ABC transporter permease [Deltaproteobacteria bacterium]|nr:branched-chain amino acid ABC transporter permease [Deltaproteobacteria bacterium]MBW2154236.1 branched-chain amino acid ABC transporter permease [Deltaproteobacteria bacterium]
MGNSTIAPAYGSKLKAFQPLLIMALAFSLLPFVVPYTALANEIMLFALAAAAFDLCVGYTGVMMFCQASFFGTGVYATSLTLLHLTNNIFVAVLLGVLAASILALLFGFMASLRSGSYAVLLTLAFNEMVYFIAFQWSSVTGGDDGLTGITRPNLEVPGIGTLNLQSSLAYYFFCYVIFILAIFVLRRITFSPFGKILQAIRENEERAQAIGYNVHFYKMLVFTISGLFMGLAGSLYSMYICFAHIHNVHFETSGNIVMMVLIGGMGTLFGPMIGAFLIVLASDVASAIWERWLFVMGVLFIFFVLFARGGIWAMLQNSLAKISGKTVKSA